MASGLAEPSSARLQAWRTSMLDVLARISLALISIAAIVVGSRLAAQRDYAWIAVLVVMLAIVAACAFVRGHHALRTRLLIGAYTAYTAVGVFNLGPTGGAGAAAVGVAVLTALLLGRRDAIVATLVVIGIWCAYLALLALGVIERPSPLNSDVGRLAVAAPTVVTSAAVATTLLFATDYLLRKLRTTLAETEALVVDLQAQMRARDEEAERRREAERRLWDAQKAEALATLAGGVAHDVNNNLTVALANATLLQKRGAATPELQDIIDACENAATLTRQLLAIGRRDVMQREVVPVRDILLKLERVMGSALGSEIRGRVELPPPEVTVRVDASQLLQALLNLVLNARDALPSGGEVVVVVETGGASPDYARVSSDTAIRSPVRIHVRDTGTGITDEVLSRIFDPFFTTKAPGRGTGLGLSMVRAFAEANDGRIGVRTRLGSGSTFTLELAAVASAAIPASVSRSAAGATVLVVDDDPRVRAILVSTLHDAGYRVLDAPSGERALARARAEGPIDLLCTDVIMPGLFGEALVKRFHEEHPAGRILVCSAYINDAGLRAWIEAKALPVLRKPFTPAEVEAAVAAALAAPAMP